MRDDKEWYTIFPSAVVWTRPYASCVTMARDIPVSSAAVPSLNNTACSELAPRPVVVGDNVLSVVLIAMLCLSFSID